MDREPEYMTVSELAELVHAPEETVRYWVWKGSAPRSIKVGRRRLFARTDVRTWLEQKAVGAA